MATSARGSSVAEAATMAGATETSIDGALPVVLGRDTAGAGRAIGRRRARVATADRGMDFGTAATGAAMGRDGVSAGRGGVSAGLAGTDRARSASQSRHLLATCSLTAGDTAVSDAGDASTAGAGAGAGTGASAGAGTGTGVWRDNTLANALKGRAVPRALMLQRLVFFRSLVNA